MTIRICDVCKKEIDSNITNSLTIGNAKESFTICEYCAKEKQKSVEKK